MGQTNYTINEYGEIKREDYFFTSVKGDSAQVLPTNRRVWVIWLLSLLTFGIYSVIVIFAMSKETNVACAEDGQHTRNFWGAILLTIITFGIYGFVYYYKWANREYNYLNKHTQNGGVIRGGGMVCLMLVTLALSFAQQMAMSINEMTAFGLIYIISLIWSIIVLSRFVKQHNNVCKAYNINTFGKKA